METALAVTLRGLSAAAFCAGAPASEALRGEGEDTPRTSNTVESDVLGAEACTPEINTSEILVDFQYMI